jgi:hypothetical protein
LEASLAPDATRCHGGVPFHHLNSFQVLLPTGLPMRKAKQPKKPIDPEQIFGHALRFCGTDNYIRSAKGGGNLWAMMIAPPTMVLGAFAIELFLKCLLVMDTGQAPETTHHLGKLFRQLPHKRKRRIQELWDAGPRKKIRPFCVAQKKPDDLPNALNACANAFEDLRYVYEDPTKTLF